MVAMNVGFLISLKIMAFPANFGVNGQPVERMGLFEFFGFRSVSQSVPVI
jgi:hypothetical protein